MRPAKVVLFVFGVMAGLVGLALAGGGGTVLVLHATQRDADGYYTTSTERFETPTFALRSDEIDLATGVGRGDWTVFEGIGTVRIVAQSTTAAPVFVGIARHADAERYLAGSAHEELTDVAFDPFEPTFERRPGETAPARPGDQSFWEASASGPGTQTLTWKIEGGEWDVVVMNADASRGVRVDASVGIKTGLLLAMGLALLGAGLVAGAIAAALLVAAVKGRRTAAGAEPAPPLDEPVAPGAYPLRIDGWLEEPLSRWLWLVKWFLAIPHAVVLFFLWIAFAVLTVVAGFAILFTGRYPRSIFDFNVGVLRWTWRVTFYAFTLGTDRYPPFSLDPDATYPADLAVPYPSQLSRSLVLVKWWLLALPHYIVIGIFGGALMSWTWGWSRGPDDALFGAGLIGILVLVAGVVLAVTGNYPRQVFDFVMGMQRWTYRVWTYAGLLRDEYPPFRLDNGGSDPASLPGTPPPPSPARGDELVATPDT